MKKQYEPVFMIIAALMIGALTTVFSQIGPFLHMSAKASYTEKEAVKTVLFPGTGKCTVIFSDENEDTAGRYINKLSVTVYPKEERPLELLITVYTDEDGKITGHEQRDINPLYVKNEMIRIDRKNVVSVDIESADRAEFSVSDIRVLNGFSFHFNVFLFSVLSSFAMLFCIRLFFRDRDKAPSVIIRRFFLTAAFCFGVSMCICLPANKTGYDEETHLQAVMQTASFPSNELHVSQGLMNQLTVTEYNNPAAQPGTAEEMSEFENALSKDVDYKEGARNPEFHVMANRVPAYLSMALAAKAGKWLSLPWPVILRMMRIANLSVYIILMWLTLKVLPFGHMLAAVIGLLPQNIFMASTVSYDPFVTGCLMLGTAFLLRLARAEEEDSGMLRDTFCMLLFLFLGCLPKAVYAPLILIALIIPFRRIGGKQRKTVYICAVISVFVLTMLLFVIPTILAPADTGDIRGSSDVSEMSQIGFILANPLRFAWILISQMVRWIPQCLIGPDCTTFMGHLVTGTAGFREMWFIYFLLFVAASAIQKENRFLTAKERLWILFMCFGAGVLVWSAMYVSFTSPGAPEIDGVQGRYFIPVLFPVYLSLFGGAASLIAAKKPDGKSAKLVSNERIWYDAMMTVLVGLMMLTVWKAVILPHCM